MNSNNETLVRIPKYTNLVIILSFALYLFLIPGIIIIYNLTAASTRNNQIPPIAWTLHKSLSPKYEKWARERVTVARATELPTSNISGTEWPVFGTMFYLWATESLQEAWEKDKTLSAVAPKVYARGAIEASINLLNDPKQGSWVKKYWGDNYLSHEDVFYRMLLIGAATSEHKLLGTTKYLDVLRTQVDTFSRELDASPYGLLEDYPSQCYPSDVVTAIACIQRADKVLGTDHSAFVKRAIRGFEGKLLDERGLSPYLALDKSGITDGTSRGCNNSYVCLFAPEIWPAQAKQWYDAYEKYFWQTRWLGAGFREFPNDMPGHDWYFDVDSGPVIAGHGIAASAFGLGAARVNGRFDHAYPIFGEMLVFSLPLWDGSLVGPNILSDPIDAPHLGEAAILFNITRQPVNTVEIKDGGTLPPLVYILLGLYFVIGFALVWLGIRRITKWNLPDFYFPGVKIQFVIWLVLALGGIVIALTIDTKIGLLMLLCAQILPRKAKVKKQISPVVTQ